MESAIQRLHRFWLEHRVKMLPGATAEELDAFERAHGVRLPPDIREFLQTVNGFEECETDLELIEWWPIARWERLSDFWSDPGREDADQYFVFADFLIESHHYGVRLNPTLESENPVLLLWGPDYTEVLARSFTELIEAYLENGKMMFGR